MRRLLDRASNERIDIPNLGRIAPATLVANGLLIGLTAHGAFAAQLSGQVITVEAVLPHSVVAVVRTWQLTGRGQYVQVRGPIHAFVGVHGIGHTKEGSGRTPVGVFTMTQAFGNKANNGTRLAYFRAGRDDWWDENPNSLMYNRHVKSQLSPGAHSENLLDAGAVYAHAVVINYNTNPVIKGAGSGFFLNVSGGAPTEGCVAIPAENLNVVMRWLDPASDPIISIGIGAAARAVLHDQ